MSHLTDIKICSIAVTRLAGDPFSSFSEDDAGVICDNNYPIIKANILSRYPWRITMDVKKLERDATDPLTQWAYRHQVPNDALDSYGAIREIFPSSGAGSHPTNEYEIIGKFIYSNHLELWAKYQKDIAEADFPPYLAELMILAVCAEIADPVTDQTNKVIAWEQKAFGLPGEGRQGGYFRIATGLDAQSQPNQVFEDFEFVDVRYG